MALELKKPVEQTVGIPNYGITDKLGESPQSIVYKGFSHKDPDKALIIKVLRVGTLSDHQRIHFRQKIEHLKVLNDPMLLRPLSFEMTRDAQFITRDYSHGFTMNEWMGQQEKMSLQDFFTISCQLAAGLAKVHDAGIVHGGVKPHNILIEPKSLSVSLIDFMTALDVREVSHFIYDLAFVKGTLAYTSPEQTGRINHRVDFASDLYSLGIVFYELLTGRLPFFSLDPLELIHSHLAEEAEPVHELNPGVPETVGKIVAKLIVKQPEKRYQSAAGLLADLARCRDEYLVRGTVSPFGLGISDFSHSVRFVSKMVGRDAQAKVILGEYNQAAEGSFSCSLISGLPGIGKTRLIQELQRPIVRNRGYFTSGKFDIYQKNIPYSALIQSLRNLVRTFLTESDDRVNTWKDKILSVIGTNGRVLTDVIPELEALIGEQPEVEPLPPVESRNRFNDVFNAFLICLASKENPLTLFIDDLQWCDSATFDFLGNIFANYKDYEYLFLLGAYRHNEVDSGHPLAKLIREINKNKRPLREVRVGPLAPKYCHEMVSYILDSPLNKTAELSAFITDLSDGNPLFVSEILSYLHNEDLLHLAWPEKHSRPVNNKDAAQSPRYQADEQRGEGAYVRLRDRAEVEDNAVDGGFGRVLDENRVWQWDLDRIRESDMPSTVVALFSSKVRKLPAETIELLEYCACMGNRFSPTEIATAKEMTLFDAFETLKTALAQGLLMESKENLQFVHDRVQEAVLTAIKPEKRRRIHWEIGTHLLSAVPETTSLEKLDNLFQIVAHFNLGRAKRLSGADAYRLSDLNYRAGNKALTSLATEAANDYFREARELLPPNSWLQRYERTFKVYQKAAKTELMCGNYTDSEKLLNELLDKAQTDLDKAQALAEQTTSLSSIGNFIKAVETANRGLAFFGKALPDDAQEAERQRERLMKDIEDKNIDVWETILNMPFTRERKSKTELAFYSELIPDLYMSGLVPQLYLSAAQSTQHCLEGGMDESVIYSFTIMGLCLGEKGVFEQAFKYEDLAHDLCEKYPNTFGATRGINGVVWCNMHSRSTPAQIIDYSYKGIQCGRNSGDLYNAGLCYGPLMWNQQVQGDDFTKIEASAQECLEFSKKYHLNFSVRLAEAMQAGWCEPMKKGYEPVLMDEKLKAWEKDNHVASAGSYFVHLGLVHYYFGLYEEAERYLQEVKRYLTGLTDNVLKRQWHVFLVLNALRLHELGIRPMGTDLSLSPTEALLAYVRPLIQQVKIWAGLGPLLKPYQALVDAEMARVAGSPATARSLYLDAIAIAHKHGYTFLEGYLNECLGAILASESGETAPRHGTPAVLFKEAARLYQICGAERKEEELFKRYAQYLEEERMGTGLNHRMGTDVNYTMGTDLNLSPNDQEAGYALPNLDVGYFIKSAAAIFSEIEEGRLIDQIMKVVLQASGAQHGYLVIKENDILIVRAESHAGKGEVVNATSQKLEDCAGICQAIVRYVGRTKEMVILENAGEKGPFKDNPQVQALKQTSVLCLPLIKQSELLGIVYLENRLAENVFTPEKTEMTKLLAYQAAISFDNARLMAGKKLALQAEELARSNAELEQFAYVASHDLQEPLRMVASYMQLLADRYKDRLDGDAVDFIDYAMDGATRMKELIDDLLDYSRVGRVKGKTLEMVDVNMIVDRTLSNLESAIKETGAVITYDDLPEVRGDASQLGQLFQNLIQNAIKFRKEGGTPKIKISAKEQNKEWLFAVRDNGIGIEPKFFERIFVIFQRLHEKARYTGTGIGLAICKKIVQRYGGRMWVESRPDRGSVFYFTLPR